MLLNYSMYDVMCDVKLCVNLQFNLKQARSQGRVGPVGRPPPKCGQVRFLRSTFLSVSEWLH